MTVTPVSKPSAASASDAELARESDLCDRNGFFIEGYFVHLIAYERKKCERSLKPFLLMLVHLKHRFPGEETGELARNLATAMAEATRETDIKGWDRYPHTLGVLFTDTAKVRVPAILDKVMTSIRAHLSPAEVERLWITFHAFPGDYDDLDADGIDLQFYPDLAKARTVNKTGLLVKRVIDLAGSLAGLLLLSPLLLVVAACVRLSSRGPVFFRQERLGQCGKRFVFLKFRSMAADNDPAIHKAYVASLIEAGKAKDAPAKGTPGEPMIFKIQNDPRITPLGRFLRKTSLDELPQLINVLRGEMSLVGPRPPIPYEVEKYEVWHRRRVFEVKPGITGLWQVEGRSRTTFDEMVRLDLKYVQEWSVWMDLKILLRTPRAVLTAKGAF